MKLMNEDELGMVSGGGRKVSRDKRVLANSKTMPADNCPEFSVFDPHYNRDCINCNHYDYGLTEKCTNPKGIRFGK